MPDAIGRHAGKRRTVALLATVVLLAGLLLSGVLLLWPPRQAVFLPLWLAAGQSGPPQSEQDRAALVGSRCFQCQLETLGDLAGVKPRDSVVVYLCGRAHCDARGKVMVEAPAASNPRGPCALQSILQALSACAAGHKLLILDLFWPLAEGDACALDCDIAGRMPAELAAVPDTCRLVLCSCSPGQVALASEDLNRTVFGYYVQEGLNGWAEPAVAEGTPGAWGRITARNLARFVQVHVDRWAQHNRDTRQTPILYGEAADFPLVGATATEHLPRADVRAYPEWLRQAWTIRDRWWAEERFRLAPCVFRQLEAVLLRNERAWRGGGNEDHLRRDLQAELDRLEASSHAATALAMPAPPSLAQAVQRGAHPSPALAQAVRVLLARTDDVRRRSATAPETESALASLIDEFCRQQTLASDVEMALAVLECLAEDPSPRRETVGFLDRLLSARVPEARWVEQVGLRRLANLAARLSDADWPIRAVHRSIEVMREAEQVSCRPRSFAWVEGQLDAAAQKRHDGEVLLQAHGLVPAGAAEKLLDEAVADCLALRARQDSLETAYRLRDQALALLPAYLPYLESHPGQEPAWLSAVQALHDLEFLFTSPTPGQRPPAPELNSKIAEIRHQAALLDDALNHLQRPFSLEQCNDLIRRGSSAPANPAVYQELDALLQAPFLPADARLAVWQASRELGRRLLAQTFALDQDEHGTIQAGSDEQDLWQRRRRDNDVRKARWSIALLRLAHLDPRQLEHLQQLVTACAPVDGREAQRVAPVPGSTESAACCALSCALDRAWLELVPSQPEQEPNPETRAWSARLLPASACLARQDDALTLAAVLTWQRQTAALWCWLHERYVYESSEPDAAAFWEQAALAMRDYGRPAEPLLTLPSRPTTLDLSSAQPTVTASLPITILSAAALRSRLDVTVLNPSDDWLRVTPDLAVLQTLGQTAGPGPTTVTVPVHVTLRDAIAVTKVPRPAGFVVRVEASGRSFHHTFLLPQLPAAEAPDRLELLLSDDPVKPTSPSAELRLRPCPARQPYYVYVRNASDRPRKLRLEVCAGSAAQGAAAHSITAANLTVAAGQTLRAVFPDTGAPQATAPSGELPELAGPMQLRLLDVERQGAVVCTRDVPVAVARPADYVRVPSILYEPAGPGNGSKNRLSVTLRPTMPLSGPPCLAELVLPLRRNPALKAAHDGSFRVELPAFSKEVKLVASGIALDPARDEDGCVYLTVDGVERAFVYRTLFARAGAATVPRLDDQPSLRLYAPKYFPTNAKLVGEVEVDNPPPGSQLELSLGRKKAGLFEPVVIAPLLPARYQHVGVGTRADGGLDFEAHVSDWRAQFDPVAEPGERVMRARLLDRSRQELLAPVYQTISIENQRPQQVQLVGLPRQARQGSLLQVKASGIDRGSGMAQAVFFLGQPVADKIPPLAVQVRGQPLNSQPNVWMATLHLPPSLQGPLDIGVQLTNKAGLSAFAAGTVEVVDFDPETMAPGVIMGTVLDGQRPQVGVAVAIVDERNVKVAEQQTREGGAFRFDNVRPGKYRVTSLKKTSATPRTGSAEVQLKPRATVTVRIDLFAS